MAGAARALNKGGIDRCRPAIIPEPFKSALNPGIVPFKMPTAEDVHGDRFFFFN